MLVGGPLLGAAHAQPSQVALTASFSIVGGGGSQVEDYLTYTSGGVQQVVPLTQSPTVYMVDAGSEWSVQGTLTGSNSTERWMTNQDVSGTIAAAATFTFSYYRQYLMSFNFNVTNAGVGFSPPAVTFDQFGEPITSSTPGAVWVDAASSYSYAQLLPGSSSGERWALETGGTGTVTSHESITVTYYHQYLVSSSYSVVDGGNPSPPTLTSTAFDSTLVVTMKTSTQDTWLDAGASYSFSASLPGATSNETWTGTILQSTTSGEVISTDNNGTLTGPTSITPAYYHQFQVGVEFVFFGGSTDGLTPPDFTFQSLGSKDSASSNATVWVDSGSAYSLSLTICCTSSPSTDRWQLNNSTAGTIAFSTEIVADYFHQYLDSFSYSFSGQPPGATYTQPQLAYVAGGKAQQLGLLESPQGVWADSNTNYSASDVISGTSPTERWFAQSAAGVVGPALNNSVDIVYYQQYLVTIAGGATPNEWVDAGTNVTLSAPGVLGRSEGSGYRVVSYEIDSGSVVQVSKPATVLAIQLSLQGPGTITFQSVRQFQVSLDAGASAALSSITPPTIPGDDYWYDTGSQVQVVLGGTWGRADGVGHLITSISATGEPTIQVDTVGKVQAYSTASLASPISITTTSVTQYEVVLNAPALAAFSSISPPSTFPNDTFWYDSGSPAVTVVLDGVYSRSAGTGTRTASWELNSGAVNKVAQTGPITIVTKAMTAPQFVNATSVTQYEVTLDKGGSSALVSITNPSIPLDSGWYDASSPVGVVMNGVWARSAGAGQRLAGYSLDGGPEVAVASTGQVDVLNLTGISSPEAITTTVVTQYQVTLDSGAGAALASATPTPIPKDDYWYDAGTAVSVSLNGVWARTDTTGDRLVSYSVNQGASTSVLSPSPVQVLSVAAISGPESITTKTVVQYHLTSTPLAWVSATNSTVPGDAPGWFDAGTKASAVFDSVWNQTSSGSRESVVSYALNGGGKTDLTRSGNGTFTVTVSMTEAEGIVLTSVTQYLLTVVGPPHVTASPPSQTADYYFDSGSKVKITVPTEWNGTSGPGTEEMLDSYSIDGAPPVSVAPSPTATSFTTPVLTFTGPQTVDFGAVADYKVEFQFFDGLGNVQVQPSALVLGIGNSTVSVQGLSVWLENGTTFTVTNVSWEGASVGPSPPPSYHVKAAPLNVTLDTQVYPASLSVVDPFGLPVSGAQVSMALANGTTLTGTTSKQGTFSAGLIPVGTYTAKVTSLGTSVQIRGDAASGQSVAVGKVALSLIMLFVVVAVAAAAGSTGFFVYRRKKRAKKPAAKVSESK